MTSSSPGDRLSYAPDGEVVELCSELIRFDTTNYGNGKSNGERDAAEYVAAKLDEVGIESTIYESEPGRASLVAHWEGEDKDADPLLVHGHLDVVPADPKDWKVDPFAGEIFDGCVWGRGAVDMKDFDAMVLSVVRARQRAGVKPRRPVRLVFTADEEAGGLYGAQWLIKNHPETVQDCTEGIGEVGGFSLTMKDDLRLYLIETAEKGMNWMRLKARGTAGHGSMVNNDNAVTNLVEAVTRIGNHEWPLRLTPTVKEFLSTLEDVLGTKLDPEDMTETLVKLGSFSRMFGATIRNTANPTMLNAGYKVNVIPGDAEAHIDGRFLPGYEDEFFATIDELLGDKVTRETVIEDIALETGFDGRLVEIMRSVLSAEDPQSRTAPLLMSGGTDAKSWSRLGVRCFGFVPLQLPPDLDFMGMFHGIDERVPTASLEFGSRVLDRFFTEA
ncbi:M20/M25/M40 family metallo-hydrolase [Streptomyces sp. SID13031]|uniref:M20/M25/M40 family metallo-hydrolase n=1 Tax=Streptomyces sp. SID13031 TaxID=2706046 RepID=UPI0013CB280E|nr:M20/M25/M40 family metallo-hydrolase [Streptomyces sp. SID13031]NEA30766.1 M20/M25/M40 family metallo-hydrolase [Streptomyces sp. SID13031]